MGFVSPELLDTLEALNSFTELLDKAMSLIRLLAGSEIHGTPKLSLRMIMLIRKCNFVNSTPFRPASSNCAVAITIGPVYLPTKKQIQCVLKSPHGHKDARFRFEIRTHQRLIDILYPTEQTLESLMRLDFPFAVDVK
ncbi:hypothetical protein MKX03_020029, partial [Papaver bracteatum]